MSWYFVTNGLNFVSFSSPQRIQFQPLHCIRDIFTSPILVPSFSFGLSGALDNMFNLQDNTDSLGDKLLFSCLCSKVPGCQVTGYSLSLIKEIFKHCWHNWLNFRWLRQPFQFRKLRRFWGIKLRQHIYGKFQLNHCSWQNRNVYDNFTNTIWTNWWSWKKI